MFSKSLFFLCIFKSVVSPIQYILHLGHSSFYLWNSDLDLFYSSVALFRSCFEYMEYNYGNWFYALVC